MQETYRIEAGATDLALSRSPAATPQNPCPDPVHGHFQATLDLTRTAVYPRSLRLTAQARGAAATPSNSPARSQDFTRPHWQAKAQPAISTCGSSIPVLGYPFAPEGIAHLDLDGAG